MEEDKCENCGGSGFIEVMGGSDGDEWGVIGTKPCAECNYEA